ncbi:MAG: hypothetical protein HY518_03760 [Candidatus Aenigmarchaeota archaeon]|nr:hypothetical protein [Candidatus Aenigmarchaeota archaeon]
MPEDSVKGETAEELRKIKRVLDRVEFNAKLRMADLKGGIKYKHLTPNVVWKLKPATNEELRSKSGSKSVDHTELIYGLTMNSGSLEVFINTEVLKGKPMRQTKRVVAHERMHVYFNLLENVNPELYLRIVRAFLRDPAKWMFIKHCFLESRPFYKTFYSPEVADIGIITELLSYYAERKYYSADLKRYMEGRLAYKGQAYQVATEYRVTVKFTQERVNEVGEPLVSIVNKPITELLRFIGRSEQEGLLVTQPAEGRKIAARGGLSDLEKQMKTDEKGGNLGALVREVGKSAEQERGKEKVGLKELVREVEKGVQEEKGEEKKGLEELVKRVKKEK